MRGKIGWRENGLYYYRDSKGKKGNGLEIEEERRGAAVLINKSINCETGFEASGENKVTSIKYFNLKTYWKSLTVTSNIQVKF